MAAVAAEAFVRSYADAMELSLSPTTTIESCASALAAHYSPSFVSFTLGHVVHGNNDPNFWPAGILSHLKRLDKSVGWKVKLKSHRIEVLSGSATAACYLTWEIVEPKIGGEAWCWGNVYGWRRDGNGKGEGTWEYVVSDNEVLGLIQRVPNFMDIEI